MMEIVRETERLLGPPGADRVARLREAFEPGEYPRDLPNLEILLRRPWRRLDALLERGTVYGARVVMANTALFSPDSPPRPAQVLVTRDRRLLAKPARMAEIGHRLYRFHEAAPSARPVSRLPSLRQLHSDLSTGLTRVPARRVPLALSEGHLAWHLSLLLLPRHLGGALVTSVTLPLLWLPDDHPVAMVVPRAFWPDATRAAWQAEVDARHEPA